MKLYYHKTDGGAEYLCSSNVAGTDEGSFQSEYIVRIDGDITKDAELFVKVISTGYGYCECGGKKSPSDTCPCVKQQ